MFGFGYEVDAPVMSAAASLLSACAAAGGVLFAVIKGSQELNRWRTQQRDAKRADVAGQALATALRYLSTLERATTPAMVETDDGPEFETMYADSRWRVAAIDAVAPDFERAFELAQTHLPDPATAVLEKVSDLGSGIRWAHMNLSNAPAGHQSAGIVSLHREAFGQRRSIEELRKEARTVLRPLAQHA